MKFLRLLSLLLILPLFTACFGVNATELGDRLMIEAIGIDSTSDGYKLTLLASDLTGENDRKDSKTSYKLFSFRGLTPGDALGKVSGQTGLVPLYSEARLLIIGSPTAKDDIAPLLDFFLREYKARSNIYITVAASTAEELLNGYGGTESEDIGLLQQALEKGYENGTAVNMPLYKFVNFLYSDNDCAYCPYLGLTDKNRPAVIGTALFAQNRLSTVITAGETATLLLLSNELKQTDITLTHENTAFTLSVIKAETGIKTKKETDGIKFYISSVITADITDYQSDDGHIDEITVTDITETVLLNREKALLNALYRLRGCDICRLRKRVLLKYPRTFDAFSEIPADDNDIRLSVRVNIRRTGRNR